MHPETNILKSKMVNQELFLISNNQILNSRTFQVSNTKFKNLVTSLRKKNDSFSKELLEKVPTLS